MRLFCFALIINVIWWVLCSLIYESAPRNVFLFFSCGILSLGLIIFLGWSFGHMIESPKPRFIRRIIDWLLEC